LPDPIALDPEQQAKFDNELGWCIRKINSGIQNEKDSKKSKKFNEFLIIKNLKI
jgi:hypothetical protein